MPPATGVTTSAALCTLTVAAPLLQKDVVLQLVLHLASDKQVTTKTVKKGNDLNLTLLSGVVLTQRAAILRALAGPALHFALDEILLASHGAASQNGGSVTSIFAMASLQSYMTVAHQLTTGASDPSTVMAQLETSLEQSSFLIPSAQATLADFEVGIALFGGKDAVEATPNVLRWWTTVHAQMTQLGATGLADAPQAVAQPLPAFFYGHEDFVAAKKPTGGKPQGGGGAAAGKPQGGGGGGDLTDEQKKAAADKRAQKAANKAKKKPQQAQPAAKELDITALDIRVGKIIKAWHHAEADKLFCEEIDMGEDKPRQIASGLRPFYKTEDLEGRHVLVLANLKSRNLVGFPSHGMVLCASNADHTAVEFVVPPPDVPLGERVMFGDLTGDPEPENKVAKKKFAEKLLPDLKTTADGSVVWKTHAATTTKGAVKAVNGMAEANVG